MFRAKQSVTFTQALTGFLGRFNSEAALTPQAVSSGPRQDLKDARMTPLMHRRRTRRLAGDPGTSLRSTWF